MKKSKLMKSAKQDRIEQYAIKYIVDGTNDLENPSNENIHNALHYTCALPPGMNMYKDIRKLIKTRDEWYK
ncbi:hypothetical protein bcgnr5390_09840 [Bacillus luti]|nr:hypothetical protein BC2903_31070 [Bacillus cereus]